MRNLSCLPRTLRSALGIAFALVVSTLFTSPVLAQGDGVFPLLNLVENDLTTGTTTATFGYTNINAGPSIVPLGGANFFIPGPINRGQPTTYLSGHHSSVFSATFSTYSNNELLSATWTLGISNVKADPASATTYVRAVGAATTYTHTSSSFAIPSSTVIVESLGTLVMESGTFSAATVTNRGTGTVRLEGGALSASTSFTNSAVLNLAGGSLATPSFANTGDGVITVVSGTNTLPSFTNAGRLRVEAGSLDVASLANNGLVEVSGGALSLGSAPTLGSSGVLRLDGGTLVMPTLANSGGTLDLRAGTLRLTTADLVANTGGILGANPVLSAPVTVELQAGRADIASGRSLTLANGALLRTQGGENNGTLYVINASLASQSGEFVNQSGRTLYAVDAALSFAGDGLRNLGTLNLVNTTVDGDVVSPAGSTINVSNTVVFNGDFHGAANFTGSDTAVFNGGYSPGDSPALVTHEGNLVLGSENLLVMELAGLARGTG